MKLLLLFPSKGGSTSLWHFLKQHPDIQSTDKKMMADQENYFEGDNWFWPSQEINGDIHNSDTDAFLTKDVNEYYSLWDMKSNKLCLDGTDNVIDKHYFQYIPKVLNEFNEFYYFYVLRNPLDQLITQLLYFNLIYPEYGTNFKQPLSTLYKTFFRKLLSPGGVQYIIDYYKEITITKRLKKLYATKGEVLIYFLEDIIEKQSEIYEKLGLNPDVFIEFPHVNSTKELYKKRVKIDMQYKHTHLNQIKDYYSIFRFVKKLCITNKQIREVVLDDCKNVKNKFGIDIIGKYNL